MTTSFASSFTDASGWVLVILLCATIALPYAANRASRRAGVAALVSSPLRAHFWIGYGIALVTIAHGWVPMRPEIAGQANPAGLYFATGALALVLLQLAIGLALKRPGSRFRRAVKRCHFWVMVVLVGMTLGHVVLNSALGR